MTSSVSDSAAVTASQMPLMSSHLGSSKIAAVEAVLNAAFELV